MEECTARATLRIIAIVTVLVGSVLTSSAIIMAAVMDDIGAGSRHAATLMDATVVAHGQTVLWGIVLYALSSRLAKRVAS